VQKKAAGQVAKVLALTQREAADEDGRLETPISTRAGIETCKMMKSGFTLIEAAEFNIVPLYSEDGSSDSERTFIRQQLQEFMEVESETFGNKENEEEESTEESEVAEDGTMPFPFATP